MKNLYVFAAGALLLFALLFPNGVKIPAPPVTPVTPVVVPDNKPTVPPDATIVALLAAASPADKAHVAGIYAGLGDVITRDAGKLIKTTEQWSLLQANALTLAVDGTKLKGKYPGLDAAIEAVFESKLGKEKEVVPADEATRAKILEACSVIVSSVQ